MAQRGFMSQQWALGAVDGRGEGMSAHPGLRGIHRRQDSYDTTILEQALEKIKAGIYERKKPKQEFLPYIPLDTSGGAGQKATGFVEGDSRAEWKEMADKANDHPLADAKSKKLTFPVMSYFSGYDYWWSEMQAAMRAAEAGLDPQLNTRKAMACRDAYDELLENHILFGSIDHGVYGLFNHPDIKRQVITTTATTLNAVTITPDTSADNMYDSLVAIWKDVMNQSAGIEKPTHIFVPGALYREAVSTFFSSRDTSVAQRFTTTTGLALTPIERFDSLSEDKLRSGGSSSTTKSVALAGAFSPQTVEKMVPQPFLQMPAYQEGAFRTVVPCVTQLGGLHVYHPLAFKVYEGVWSAS